MLVFWKCRQRRSMHGSIIIVLVLLLLIITIFLLARIYWEAHHFVIRNYLITNPKLDTLTREIRIVFIGDLHNHCYGKDNDILVQAIREQEPELILITGDMIVAKNHVSYDVAVRFLQQLPSICPVYYANGNHEQRLKAFPQRYGEYEPYRKLLINAGIHVLENPSEDIKVHGIPIRITGLEIPLIRRSEARFNRKERVDAPMIRSLVGKHKKACYEILLAHNPMHYKGYLSWGADLILSGHLHGGMIRIPGWRGLVTPHMHLLPKYSGEITKFKDQALLITRGLGSHTIKIRLFNKAEVVVIHLTTKAMIEESVRIKAEELTFQQAYTIQTQADKV